MGQLKQLENPLRYFSRKVTGLRDIPYSRRLQIMRLYSVQRRVERYRILYIFKMLTGKVLDLGLKEKQSSGGRFWFQLVQAAHITRATGSTRTLIARSIMNQGPMLFNLLPEDLKMFCGSVYLFKVQLDRFLQTIPDVPRTESEEPAAQSLEGVPSNRLEDWVQAITSGRIAPNIAPVDCDLWCL